MPHGKIAKDKVKITFTSTIELRDWLDERSKIENRSRSNFILDYLEKLRDEEESNY